MFTMEDTELEVHEPGTVLEVELRRKEGEGFGLNIVGGTDSNEFGNHSGVFISSITDGGPAYKCRHLDVGDRILQINEFSLVSVKHRDAVNAFRSAGQVINLKIEKFGQQLIVAKFSTDVVDAPHASTGSTTTIQHLKTFLNSWAGAILIGTAAGMMAMFTFTKLSRPK